MPRPAPARRTTARAVAVMATLAVAATLLLLAPSAPASAAARGSEWIVVLKGAPSARSADVAADHARRFGAEVRYTYSHAVNGYAAVVPDASLAALRADPAVASVSASHTFRVSGQQANPPSWGLDRIDQQALPLNDRYRWNSDGTGVTAYVIDTGVFTGHNDFGGRASSGFDAIDGGAADDCHGHGTHVAGTIGGTTYGVAKNVTIKAVRVLDCGGSGTTAQVVAGIDWVTGDHDPGEPAVANMSLGGSADNVLDQAVRNSIADGVSYAIAAGNGDPFFGFPLDACTQSPARVGEAMTIGASDIQDRAASFSNYGTCIDWFAPGVNITSAWIGGANASNRISGTSMATPHTAGVAAQFLQTNPTATPAQVRNAIFRRTTKNIVTQTPQTPNNDLLFTRF
ncbi:MAG TPA: S8 family peptidase [Acidimicrobiales bacterium]